MKAIYRKISFAGIVYYYLGDLIRSTKCKHELLLTDIVTAEGMTKTSLNEPFKVMVNKNSVRLI